MTVPNTAADSLKSQKSKRVGFLATGAEIISGEILNTNGQSMAKAMLEHGISLGEQIIVDDQPDNIAAAFKFLLARHDAIISTGGLGPTSDDVTRNAIAEVLGLELIFHPESYEKIIARFLKKYGHPNLPISNQRQAYFPQDSIIFPNLNGTADACLIQAQEGKLIYLLPGPPHECLPLFSDHVLPHLLSQAFATPFRLYRWTVTGIPEAEIAEKLELALKEFNLCFSYRARSPYIDIKLTLSPSPELERIIKRVRQVISPYISA